MTQNDHALSVNVIYEHFQLLLIYHFQYIPQKIASHDLLLLMALREAKWIYTLQVAYLKLSK